jgi:hypothetical protein
MPTNTYNDSAHSTLYTAHSTTPETPDTDGLTPIHAAHVKLTRFPRRAAMERIACHTVSANRDMPLLQLLRAHTGTTG